MTRRRGLIRQLEGLGLEVRVTSRQHLRVMSGNKLVTTMAGTPSDGRSDRNALAQLRRAGYSSIKL